MKLITSILLILSITYSFPTTASEAEIKAIMKSQESAWNKGDLEGFMKGYWQSDKLQFVGKNGIKRGWQTTLDNYKKSYPDKNAMGELKFDILDIQVEGDSAFVLGKWKLKREKDELNGFYTLYWKKFGSDWRIIIDHSS